MVLDIVFNPNGSNYSVLGKDKRPYYYILV